MKPSIGLWEYKWSFIHVKYFYLIYSKIKQYVFLGHLYIISSDNFNTKYLIKRYEYVWHPKVYLFSIGENWRFMFSNFVVDCYFWLSVNFLYTGYIY